MRHGATEWSSAGRLTGWTDLPLTRGGIAQARALHRRLRGERFDHAWTSDLLRARQTANIALPVEARVDSRIRELRFGRWEGFRFVDLPQAAQISMLDFDSFDAPDGETTYQLMSRVNSFLSDLQPGRHIVITHGGVMRAIFRSMGVAITPPHPGQIMCVRIDSV